MSVELAACIALFAVALPVCRAAAWHYLAMVALNVLFLGCEYADSSILAMAFGAVAIVDFLLFNAYRHGAILVSSIAMFALSLESIGNGDWLLNHADYISIATNTLIIASLVKEYLAWMRGRSARW